MHLTILRAAPDDAAETLRWAREHPASTTVLVAASAAEFVFLPTDGARKDERPLAEFLLSRGLSAGAFGRNASGSRLYSVALRDWQGTVPDVGTLIMRRRAIEDQALPSSDTETSFRTLTEGWYDVVDAVPHLPGNDSFEREIQFQGSGTPFSATYSIPYARLSALEQHPPREARVRALILARAKRGAENVAADELAALLARAGVGETGPPTLVLTVGDDDLLTDGFQEVDLLAWLRGRVSAPRGSALVASRAVLKGGDATRASAAANDLDPRHTANREDRAEASAGAATWPFHTDDVIAGLDLHRALKRARDWIEQFPRCAAVATQHRMREAEPEGRAEIAPLEIVVEGITSGQERRSVRSRLLGAPLAHRDRRDELGRVARGGSRRVRGVSRRADCEDRGRAARVLGRAALGHGVPRRGIVPAHALRTGARCRRRLTGRAAAPASGRGNA